MNVWLDAHISPELAVWLRATFGVDAHAVRDLGLRDARDEEIFRRAGAAGAVVITKDSDFVQMLERHGAPPQVLWLTCGNTSNAHLKKILQRCFPEARNRLQQGEPLVEITDVP